MKVLVTGAAGFIGNHVVKCLLEFGYQVRALHLPKENLANLEGLDIEYVSADITSLAEVLVAMEGCDKVIHLAGIYALWLPNPELMFKVNVDGTRNILQAAKQLNVGRVVCTSSIARFGGQGQGVSATEESPFALASTKSQYAISKAEGHEVAVAAARAGQDVVICSPTGPIGPNDIGPTPTGKLVLGVALMPVFATPHTINNSGDVRDIALGHVLALEKGRTGESYLLGNADISSYEMAKLTMEILGIKKTIYKIPFLPATISGYLSLWYTKFVSQKAPMVTPDAIAIAKLGLAADCSKAVTELGLPLTPLKVSLTDSLIWFAENGYIRNKSILEKISGLKSEYKREDAAYYRAYKSPVASQDKVVQEIPTAAV